jgi:hypothetical protein
MASTYVNDLRLNEMATGDASGSWGTVTNTNLELIGEAFSYGTETIGDADSTLTIADGASDPVRSFFLKITSSVDLTTTRIVTLAPNTVSKVWMIENATTGSQVITIKQGSGATINVPNGQVKMISTDGAGSGGAVLDLLVDVDLTGTTTLVNLDVSGAVDIAGDLTLSAGGDGALRFTAASSVKVLDNDAAALVFEEADNAYMTFVTTDGSEAVKFDKALDINAATQIDATVTVGVDDTGYDVKFFGATTGKSLLWDESADSLIVTGTTTLVGTTNLDAVDIDGATQIDATVTVGVDDTGYDVKFFGATAGAYMLWDESADDLILGGAAGLSVNSTALVTGVLTTTAATVFNGGFTANADSTLGTDKKVQFRDAAIYINSSVDGQLDIVADTEIQIAATTIDIDGTIVATTSTDQAFPLTVSNTDLDSSTYIKYVDNAGQYWTTGINYANNDFVMAYGGTNVAVFANAGGLTVTSADNLPQLTLVSTDADALVGPQLNLWRNSGSAANGDLIGQITFTGEDALSNTITYASIHGVADQVDNGAEDGSIRFSTRFNDVLAERLAITQIGGVTINDTGIDADFRVESDGNANMLFVDGGNNRVGVGTGSPSAPLEIKTTGDGTLFRLNRNAVSSWDFSIGNTSTLSGVGSGALEILPGGSGTPNELAIGKAGTTEALVHITTSGTTFGVGAIFNESGADSDFRVESATTANALFVEGSSGNVGIGVTADPSGTTSSTPRGQWFGGDDGPLVSTTYQQDAAVFNRLNNDGSVVSIRQAGVEEGNISVAGTTVSYNGGHLARWSQLADNTRDDTLLKGTVLTNLDQMAVWGDEDNEQLNCMAKSSVEGDANVAGVFVNWDNDDKTYSADMNIAMTGDMIIRIAQGTTVARGDLLMSAGDGTAKPQGDDIVRGKTIAKITSTHVTCTYDDGSYCVPCVLMAC